MKLKAVFLCGDRSRYGLAHLKPILENFDVVSVVVGTDETWTKFRNMLKGGEQYEPPKDKVMRLLKRSLSAFVTLCRIRRDLINASYICKSRGIPLLKIRNVNDPHFIESLKKLNCDVLLSAAYPQILQKNILSFAPKGSINFHPSLLPKYRGAHPHFWCIAKGEDASGVTAHFMTERIDDGHIVSQRSFSIKEYYYSDLYDRLDIESNLLVKEVSSFLKNSVIPIKQDVSEASYFRNDREIHRRMFWDCMSAQELLSLIRTENAFFFLRGNKVFPKRATITENNRNMTNDVYVPPGVIVDIKSSEVVVSTKEKKQFLSITDIAKRRFQKKGIIPWARRNKVSVGMRLS